MIDKLAHEIANTFPLLTVGLFALVITLSVYVALKAVRK